MIKKIICLLLLLTCSFALFACGEEEPPVDDVPPADTSLPDEEFFEMVSLSAPNKIVTVNTVTVSASETYVGEFTTTIMQDGSIVHEYTYEEKREASLENLGKPGSKEINEGEIVYKNGLYSYDGEESWTTEAPDESILNVKFDLNRDYIGEYKMSKDGKTLTATVNSENAEKILGIKINAKGDVTIKVATNGTYLDAVTVTYATAKATVKVDTSYNYEPVSSETEAPAE